MPIRGIIWILLITVIAAFIYRNEIYKYIKKFLKK